ncbi:hypothetical protein Droror1_Dr00010530 [Drosera rotundifolia]
MFDSFVWVGRQGLGYGDLSRRLGSSPLRTKLLLSLDELVKNSCLEFGFLCADKLLCEQGGEELLAGRGGNLDLFTFKRTRVVKNQSKDSGAKSQGWIELTGNWISWKVMA